MAHRSFKRPHDGLFSTRSQLATSTQDQGAKVTWAGRRQEAASVVLPKGWSSGCAYQSLAPHLILTSFIDVRLREVSLIGTAPGGLSRSI